MNYTPHAHLSDEEFVRHLATKDDPTTDDTECLTRIERLLEDLLYYKDAAGVEQKKVETRYAE